MNPPPNISRQSGALGPTRRVRRQVTMLGLCFSFALAMAAGCNTLPTVSADVAANPRPVTLKGARGPLSAQQSKAILERLAKGSQESSIFDRHLAVEESLVDSPLSVGNKVTALQDGPATFKAMFAAVRAAKDHIHVETYIIEDDELGREFTAALIEKQKQGVPVRLIYDSVGTINVPAEFFKNLKDNGIQVLEFNPVNPLNARKGWEINQRDHRKLLIVDGHTAFLGGINISGVYSSGSFSTARRSSGGSAPTKKGKDGGLVWRDTHVQIEGPVVAEFQKMFLATWEKQSGAPLPANNHFPTITPRGNEVVRAVGSSPDDPYSQIYVTLISAINSAETSVHLTNAYFVPDPQLLEALKNAAKRGVDVKIILPSQTDFWLVFHAGRSYYSELLRAGVKIFERRDALLHAKTALIDGVWSTIGSTNLDWRSFLHNDEINAVVLGQSFGEQMRAMFEADLAASTEVTMTSWGERPIGNRVREVAARIWKYWL
jgi:cardiolipin synthase A/B